MSIAKLPPPPTSKATSFHSSGSGSVQPSLPSHRAQASWMSSPPQNSDVGRRPLPTEALVEPRREANHAVRQPAAQIPDVGVVSPSSLGPRRAQTIQDRAPLPSLQPASSSAPPTTSSSHPSSATPQLMAAPSSEVLGPGAIQTRHEEERHTTGRYGDNVAAAAPPPLVRDTFHSPGRAADAPLNSHTPRAPPVQDCVTVVVKGTSAGNSAFVSLPYARIVEVNADQHTVVGDVIERCLSVVESQTQGRSITIDSVTLEQLDVALNSSSLLGQVSEMSELYFLIVKYKPQHQKTSASNRAAHGIASSTEKSTEERLCDLEDFVRAHPAGVEVSDHTSPPQSSRLPLHTTLSPITAAVVSDDVSAFVDTYPHGVESYTAQAEKLSFLVLETRNERLAKLDAIKKLITDHVELYQWMSTQTSGEPFTRGSRATHAPSVAAMASRQSSGAATKSRTSSAVPSLFKDAAAIGDRLRDPAAEFGQSYPPTTSGVDHDNVHVDYDPVLDIWKLRKGPPL